MELTAKSSKEKLNSIWLHVRLLENLGLAICALDLPAGAILKTEEIELQYKVSRSVVRETVRVLESIGLVSARRRLGVVVLPSTSWNFYDPKVIRWRLASSERIKQLRSLTELRVAIEPEAARLAAVRATHTMATELLELSERMQEAGRAGDQERFLSLDIQFHKIVLLGSGNEMFAKLDGLVAEVLTGRTHYGLMPIHPHETAIQLHSEVATAIKKGAGDSAHDAMLAIMERTLGEMSILWESQS